jgi:hypothetical protein
MDAAAPVDVTSTQVMSTLALTIDVGDVRVPRSSLGSKSAGAGGTKSSVASPVVTQSTSKETPKNVEEALREQLQLMFDRLPPNERTAWLQEATHVRRNNYFV